MPSGFGRPAFVRTPTPGVSVNRPRFITADMVKEGVIAFDFGSNYIEDIAAPNVQRLVGDLDFEPVRAKAKAITPVP